MRKTSDFELITEKNLERLKITREQIRSIESFEYLPGTLYPEKGKFSEAHPTGGSFGVHLYLEDGRDAWLYGRISFDYNVKQDHEDKKPHWNCDIQPISPEGEPLEPYTAMSWHGLPDSQFLEINITNHKGKKGKYKIER